MNDPIAYPSDIEAYSRQQTHVLQDRYDELSTVITLSTHEAFVHELHVLRDVLLHRRGEWYWGETNIPTHQHIGGPMKPLTDLRVLANYFSKYDMFNHKNTMDEAIGRIEETGGALDTEIGPAPDRLILQPCPQEGWTHPDRVPHLGSWGVSYIREWIPATERKPEPDRMIDVVGQSAHAGPYSWPGCMYDAESDVFYQRHVGNIPLPVTFWRYVPLGTELPTIDYTES